MAESLSLQRLTRCFPGTERRALDDPMLTDVWGGALTRLTLTLLDTPGGTVEVTLEECP